MRAEEARKNAGDPGHGPGAPPEQRRVQLHHPRPHRRRISSPRANSPSTPPIRRVSTTPANRCTMSPALLNKYLQAAREVGDHMVLDARWLRFRAAPDAGRDRSGKYTIQRIVNFYDSQPTDFADYFEAAWRYKYRAALGKPNATLAAIAAEVKGQSAISGRWSGSFWKSHEEKRKSARSRNCKPCGAPCRRPRPIAGPAEHPVHELHRDARLRGARSAAIPPCSSPRPSCKGLPGGSQPC